MTKSGFLSASEAAAARAKVVEQHRAGLWPQHSGTTVGEWLESWYRAKVAADAIRPTTAACYRQHIDHYLVPHLGNLRLSQLRGVHVTAMYVAVRLGRAEAIARYRQSSPGTAEVERGRGRGQALSNASVVRLHATLHAALNAAVRAGECAANVARQAEVPSGVRAKVRPWTPEAYGAFLDFVEGGQDRMAPLFHVAGHTGLRRGELCGLRWEDVDLERRSLVVRRQVVEAGSRVLVGKPKTRSGEDRVVDLDAGTVRVLSRWKSSQSQMDSAAEVSASGYVFTGPDGGRWHPSYITHRFAQLVSKAGVPRCRLHDLRHLCASLQLAAGVDIAIVSKRLGHSTYTITADTYCHLLPGVGRAAAEASAALVPRARARSAS
ncbi:tyrosine-type recombinase/integrase [Crossiella sp. CA-258035]|uniref:tyrosine-type recombinase/integrase n=1 Tax=Crossiella sp. CA-258035 TaxID=2981138 RepID=UPI0024BC8DE1|nr:site-specific integrase [Crossiella sp. CA-258035]WHT20675.1 tyrosine-type recombinase/integrase [Crossiella sp. CA-258035]